MGSPFLYSGELCDIITKNQPYIYRFKVMFPGCIVTKNESYICGFPDLTIYYRDMWATLECKRTINAKKQPLQEYYVDLMNKMSFSRFICPENKEEVLDDLQRAFEV